MTIIALLIDGANTEMASQVLGGRIDFGKLRLAFGGPNDVVCARYYAVVPDDDREHPAKRLYDWLGYNGYVVRECRGRVVEDGDRRRLKGDISVSMTVDAMNLASKAHKIVLFSGSQSFVPMISELQRRGVHVTVVSTADLVADEVRRQADEYMPLETIGVIGSAVGRAA